MSMDNSNDTIGNRIRDFPVCSAVPQPTVPPRAPILHVGDSKYKICQFDGFKKNYTKMIFLTILDPYGIKVLYIPNITIKNSIQRTLIQ
jgi:hypothetical protein